MFHNSGKIRPFEKKVWLSSPTMHGEELEYMKAAYDTNWMSTAGENINELERLAEEHMGGMHAVALSCGTAALHLAVKLAAGKLYGSSTGISTPDGLGRGGSLYGRRVFCTDMTFDATVNPVVYEGGEPVFIDTEAETWNMSPEALERAFGIYPDVKLVVMAHLYGTPGRIREIREICDAHGALLIEDAAESLGAACRDISRDSFRGDTAESRGDSMAAAKGGTTGGLTDGRMHQTGTFGNYSIISFNGNKIITGSSGGMLFCHTKEEADKARKWSTQSREDAPWYQHEELGYNYRMSNVIAGVVRGQWGHLWEHIERKKEIYERYREGLKGLPVRMNPYDAENSAPNFWLSCLLIDREALCESVRSEKGFGYRSEKGKSCPDEILEALKGINAEGRPIWKPMHMQPVYRMNKFIQMNGFVMREGNGRAESNAYLGGGTVGKDGKPLDMGMDIFERGLCLPSDVKMTVEEQEKIIDVICRCFA